MATDWFHHVWAKTLVVHEVFKHGVDVLFADAVSTTAGYCRGVAAVVPSISCRIIDGTQ